MNNAPPTIARPIIYQTKAPTFCRFATFDSDTFEDLTALESLYAEHMGTLITVGDSAFGTMPMLKTLSLRYYIHHA